MIRNRFITLVLFLLSFNASQLTNVNKTIKEKHISVLVSSKWSETPLLLEARYFLTFIEIQIDYVFEAWCWNI